MCRIFITNDDAQAGKFHSRSHNEIAGLAVVGGSTPLTNKQYIYDHLMYYKCAQRLQAGVGPHWGRYKIDIYENIVYLELGITEK